MVCSSFSEELDLNYSGTAYIPTVFPSPFIGILLNTSNSLLGKQIFFVLKEICFLEWSCFKIFEHKLVYELFRGKYLNSNTNSASQMTKQFTLMIQRGYNVTH